MVSFLKQNLRVYENLVELMVYLYQVLMIERESDWVRFSKESRMEFLAENRNHGLSGGQRERLLKKI